MTLTSKIAVDKANHAKTKFRLPSLPLCCTILTCQRPHVCVGVEVVQGSMGGYCLQRFSTSGLQVSISQADFRVEDVILGDTAGDPLIYCVECLLFFSPYSFLSACGAEIYT